MVLYGVEEILEKL